MRYERISSTSSTDRYQITVIYYQDCHHGNEQAILEDDPVYVGVYRDQYQMSILTLPATSQPKPLPVEQIGCATFTEPQCIRALRFSTFVDVPKGVSFTVTNQRCCMPSDLINLKDAGRQGITLSVQINGGQYASTGPVFQKPPPGFWCANVPFSFDLSATDPDGDSLSYRLTGVPSGGTANDAKPNPPLLPGADVNYAAAYSPFSPFANNGGVTLDPLTGLLNGVCHKAGAYLIGVACDEWRKGVRIGTSYRYYGYTFDDCSFPVIASIQRSPLPVAVGDFSTLISQCNGDRTVHFTNASRGALRYFWDFGDPSRSDDTSGAANPSYTYPGPGTYQAKLIAYGNGCTDSLTGKVVIGDAAPAVDFRVDGGRCVLDTLSLTDLSSAGASPVTRSLWLAENNFQTGTWAPTVFTIPGKKTILHVLQTADGCYGSSEQSVEILAANVLASNDTTLTAGTTLQLHATGGVSYTWIRLNGSSTELDDYTIANPVLSARAPSLENQYVLIGKDATGCRGLDSFNVIVAAEGYAFVPNAFSPNGDGSNDVLRCHLAGQRLISFSIYDRGGTRVFTTNDITTGWDGRYHGGEAAMCTYYWMIEAVNPYGRSVFKGDVFLMR